MKLHGTILLLVMTVAAVPLKSQFTSFQAQPDTGCDSVLVRFAPQIFPATRWPSIAKVKWEFGDNAFVNAGPGDTIYHLYGAPGEYIPRMVIVDTNNVETLVYHPIPDFSIDVHETPSAAFAVRDSLPGSFVREYVHDAPFDEMLTYRWIIADSVMPPGTDRYTYVYNSEGLYRVGLIVESSAGCADTAFRSDRVIDELSAPNFFSPNEDGMNDLWVVRSNGYTTFRVRIYARTGTLVYQAETPVITWDGRNMSGQQMSGGIYYYIIEPVKNATIYKKTGFLYLLL